MDSSSIIPLNIVQIYWDVKDRQGKGGWKVDSEIKRIYYREPVSTKFEGIGNMSMETISYEVIKQFKNQNYIQVAISMKFHISQHGKETIDSENYRCLLICADVLQEQINSITKGHEYLHVDVSINSNTKFDDVPPEKSGKPRLN